MREATKYYIYGQWVEPGSDDHLDPVHPATESITDQVANGNAYVGSAFRSEKETTDVRTVGSDA